MSAPFIGEIRMMGFGFPPRGWAQCDGALLSINEQSTLFALISTTYGGDGRSTFQLPDLRGRTPLHQGPYNYMGQAYGFENIPLTEAQMPAHNHTVNATQIDATSRGGSTTEVFAKAPKPQNLYHNEAQSLVALNSGTVGHQGGSAHHNNMQPSSVINFCIALTGVFPSRN